MFKSGNVTVMAADMKKSIRFYVETLGLKLQDETEDHFALVKAPGIMIGLLHIAGEPSSQPENSGSMSIGFEVDDLESATSTLKTRGIDFHDSVDGEEARVVHFNDPDGNLLYLVCNR